MRDVIDDNDLLILVMSRFSIPFGFGDATVREVCRENSVDIQTFLAVANLVSGKPWDAEGISLRSLMTYLRNAHDYFLDYSLPGIRSKLISALDISADPDVILLILKYFNDYEKEVHKHMEHENEVVFQYVERLLDHTLEDGYNINEYSLNHSDMTEALREFKDIVIHHYRQRGSNLLNSVLYDIIGCQNDLTLHCRVENELFIPEVRRAERDYEADRSSGLVEVDEVAATAESIESISDREKEIVRCVARGLSNKEIADELCLSIHTVTTYRRNIASKLQIHSPAGLTIFAIINKLIDIRDIKLQ